MSTKKEKPRLQKTLTFSSGFRVVTLVETRFDVCILTVDGQPIIHSITNQNGKFPTLEDLNAIFGKSKHLIDSLSVGYSDIKYSEEPILTITNFNTN